MRLRFAKGYIHLNCICQLPALPVVGGNIQVHPMSDPEPVASIIIRPNRVSIILKEVSPSGWNMSVWCDRCLEEYKEAGWVLDGYAEKNVWDM
jgi:hypothetical protein